MEQDYNPTNNYNINLTDRRQKVPFKLNLGIIKRNRKLLIVLAVAIPFLLIFVAGKSKSLNFNNSSKQEISSEGLIKAKASVQVGKNFDFIAVNAQKEEVPVKFTITTVERKDEIKVKDEPKKVSSGKDFLLIRIEIQNDSTERVAIATTDRIRLEAEGGKLFAPDYHNGNVVIDPLAVKRDLVAFIVDANQKEFSFLVGELSGEKQRIEIKF